MDLGIRGRKAIVNGGSAGMGRGSVLALANEGVELYVSARGEERLVNACEEIAQQTGANITPIVADHSTDEGRERILAACPEPDILVGTCAPPATTGDYRTVSVDDWNENLAITLLSPVQFMQATIDGMVERGWAFRFAASTPRPLGVRLCSRVRRVGVARFGSFCRSRSRMTFLLNLLLLQPPKGSSSFLHRLPRITRTSIFRD